MSEVEFLPRALTKEILHYWDNKAIHVIRGPRRAGKTTLMKYLHRIKGGTYVSFENPSERQDFLSDPIGYVKNYEMPLFLDEVQLLGKGRGRVFKRIYDELSDESLKLILTGSGAFDIKLELSGALVGRAYFYDLLSLSFGEYVHWVKPNLISLYKKGHNALARLFKGELVDEFPISRRLEELLKFYLILGGYPEVVLKKDSRELLSIVNTTIEEDIVNYFGLRESMKIWQAIQRLAALSGQLLELSSLSVSYKTAKHYLSIFRYSYVLGELTTFSTNKMVELSKAVKIYFYDTGFRNAVLNKLQPYDVRDDLGPLMETFVFRQLVNKEIHYWRTKNKAEVDFVILENGHPIPIEVKSGAGRLTKSLYSFIQRYKPEIAIVVGFKPEKVKKDQTWIYVVPPYYF